MAEGTVVFEIIASAKGVKVVQKQTDALAKSSDKARKSTDGLSKSRDNYNRKEKGAAGISSNSTKNFSKMQQGIDGGGGSGGLVRAYALLAANVFALTAAFGVLSRSAQIDTLTQSMEVLSTTGGTYIKSLAKNMQEASGFAIDLAQSFRQVSLAASAGLNTSEIEGLTMVAKGAAISLGRNLPDAMDRIFRGAIKLEPEILDEIGLFIRVDEAAQKYARNNGKVVSSLTQVEKRQAFLNEILEQGTKKFQQYAEEIKPDPYVRLGAALGDIAQGGLSLLNSVLGPLLNLLAESKGLLTAVFGVLILSLLKKAIPAMGQFNSKIAENAVKAASNAREYQAGLKQNTSVAMQEANKQLAKDKEILESKRKLTGPGAVANKGKQGDIDKALKSELNSEKRRDLLLKKRDLLLKKINRKNIANRDLLKEDLRNMDKELRNLQAQEKVTAKIAANEAKGRIDPKAGSVANRRQKSLDQKATSSTILAGSSNMAEQQGMKAGFSELNKGLKENKNNLKLGARSMTRFTGTVSILGTGVSRLMMILGPWMMLFSLLAPLLMKVGKMMGFGSEQAKQFTETTKKLSDQFENLDKRFRQQVISMKDSEMSFRQNLAASTAFFKGQQETSEGIVKLKQDFDSWNKTATVFQKFWEGSKSWFGFGKEAEMNRLVLEGTKESLIGLIEAGKTEFAQTFTDAGVQIETFSEAVLENKSASDLLTEALEGGHEALDTTKFRLAKVLTEGKNAGKNFDTLADRTMALRSGMMKLTESEIKLALIQAEAHRATNVLEVAVETLNVDVEKGGEIAEVNAKKSKLMQKAMGNLQSALKGAEESVGKFNQAMMPKTKVDEILGSFNAIQAKIDELAAVSPEEVSGFFSGFADADNPLAPLFKDMFDETEDAKGKITRTLKEGFGAVEIKASLKEVQQEFDLYRITIIKAKTELKEFKDLEKRFASIASAGEGANKQQQKAITNQRKKELEVAKQLSIITIRNAGFKTDAEQTGFLNKLKAFELLGDEVKEEAWLTANGVTRIQILAIQNQLLDQKLKTTASQIAEDTELDRVKKQYNTELLKQLDLETEVIDAKRDNLSLELELAAAKSGGDVRAVDTATQTIAAAKEKFQYEVDSLNFKKLILEAEEAIVLARTKLLLMEMGMVTQTKDAEGNVTSTTLTKEAQSWMDALGKGFSSKSNALDAGLKNAALRFGLATANAIGTSFQAGKGKGILGAIQGAAAGVNGTDQKTGMIDSGKVDSDGNAIMVEGLTLQNAAVQVLKSSYQELAATMGDFGPAGMVVAGVAQGSLTIMAGMENQVAGNAAIDLALKNNTDGFTKNDEAMARGAQTAEMASSALSGIGQMMAANSKGQIAELDQQIAAEKKRDGKSKESLAKIAAMEKKKEAMQKKAFDQNKKVQMAVTIANTAASIMAALSAPPIGLGPVAGMPMAVMAGAMGALQLAVIAKTKYQGGASSVQQPTAQKMTIGKRDNSVDVSRGSSGGELSYLRGGAGVGSNANDFRPSGGAMGRKGYASGGEGILVGEQGPEVIRPSQKVDIVPNNRLGGSSNVNFSINAVDASGVENLLVEQRGNIIRMIREAANDTGERFLETVDTQAYGSST